MKKAKWLNEHTYFLTPEEEAHIKDEMINAYLSKGWGYAQVNEYYCFKSPCGKHLKIHNAKGELFDTHENSAKVTQLEARYCESSERV